MPAHALNPLDLYDVRASLSEEERMVQDSVARFVDDAVLPIIRPHFENHTFRASWSASSRPSACSAARWKATAARV